MNEEPQNQVTSFSLKPKLGKKKELYKNVVFKDYNGKKNEIRIKKMTSRKYFSVNSEIYSLHPKLSLEFEDVIEFLRKTKKVAFKPTVVISKTPSIFRSNPRDFSKQLIKEKEKKKKEDKLLQSVKKTVSSIQKSMDFEDLQELARRRRKKLSRERYSKLNIYNKEKKPPKEFIFYRDFPSQLITPFGKIGAAKMKGRRFQMEDYLSIENDKENDFYCFGIYDGHIGYRVANFVSKNLPKIIKARVLKIFGKEQTGNKEEMLKRIEITSRIIYEAFIITNKALQKMDIVEGTTTSLLIINNGIVYIANVGDSKIIELKNDGSFKKLTVDHDLKNPEEIKRLKEAGKTIQNGRIAFLNVSRALGTNMSHSQNGVIPRPFIQSFPLDVKSTSAFILASDGIWNFVDFNMINTIASNERDPRYSAIKLRNYAFKQGKSNDNISVIVLKIDNSPKRINRLISSPKRNYAWRKRLLNKKREE